MYWLCHVELALNMVLLWQLFSSYLSTQAVYER